MDDELTDALHKVVDDDTAPDDAAVARLVQGREGEAIFEVLIALIPHARARHRRLGLSEAMSDETLADIERKHRLYGAGTVTAWLLGILRGDVVQVGRLQVERQSGAHGHGLHIPETGPLTPEAVDDALRRASELVDSTRFSCESWLLDRDLAAALPDSNLASFARRFDIVDEDAEEGGDEAVAKFVFRRKPAEVLSGSVAARTSLERYVMERLRSGTPWTQPLGVLELGES